LLQEATKKKKKKNIIFKNREEKKKKKKKKKTFKKETRKPLKFEKRSRSSAYLTKYGLFKLISFLLSDTMGIFPLHMSKKQYC